MKKIHYRLGTLLGLVTALVVALSMWPAFMLGELWAQILVGTLVSYLVAWLLDCKLANKSANFFRTMVYGLLIYVSGVVAGSLLNLAISANLHDPVFGLSDQFYDWLGKPLLAFASFGMPIFLAYSLAYYFLSRILWSFFQARRVPEIK